LAKIQGNYNHNLAKKQTLSSALLSADIIMLIHRDKIHDNSENKPDKGRTEIIVAKKRNGCIGTIKNIENRVQIL